MHYGAFISMLKSDIACINVRSFV